MFDRRKLFRPSSIAFISLITVLVAGVIGGLTYMVRRGGGVIPVAGQAPNFTMTNLNDKQVSMQSLNGKVRLVTFFFTHCPDECPLTAFQMAQIQDQLQKQGLFGTKVDFISISIDPKGDTPTLIRRFAGHVNADLNGWYFLRANDAVTTQVLNKWGIQVKQGTNPEQIEHVIKTELIDPNGNIRKTYTSTVLPVKQVVSDIHSILSYQSWQS